MVGAWLCCPVVVGVVVAVDIGDADADADTDADSDSDAAEEGGGEQNQTGSALILIESVPGTVADQFQRKEWEQSPLAVVFFGAAALGS